MLSATQSRPRFIDPLVVFVERLQQICDHGRGECARSQGFPYTGERPRLGVYFSYGWPQEQLSGRGKPSSLERLQLPTSSESDIYSDNRDSNDNCLDRTMTVSEHSHWLLWFYSLGRNTTFTLELSRS